MTRIVLNAEQVRALDLGLEQGEVELVDGNGCPVGYVDRTFSKAELAAAKRRSEADGPWYTTAEVLAHLESLDIGA
jgi:hypothetical protein